MHVITHHEGTKIANAHEEDKIRPQRHRDTELPTRRPSAGTAGRPLALEERWKHKPSNVHLLAFPVFFGRVPPPCGGGRRVGSAGIVRPESPCPPCLRGKTRGRDRSVTRIYFRVVVFFVLFVCFVIDFRDRNRSVTPCWEAAKNFYAGKISLTVMAYLKPSGSRLSSRPFAVSPCGYMK